MRQPAQRRADLRAQLAANRAGAARLRELRERIGADALREAMADDVLDYAERRTRACLAELDDGTREAARRARGAPTGDLELRLTATVDGDELHARLRRHRADQHDGNLNCPLAVTALGLLVRRARAHRPRHPAHAPAPTGRSR